MPEYHEIKTKGHLHQRWSEWFADLQLTYLDGDMTLLSGSLSDQAALHPHKMLITISFEGKGAGWQVSCPLVVKLDLIFRMQLFHDEDKILITRGDHCDVRENLYGCEGGTSPLCRSLRLAAPSRILGGHPSMDGKLGLHSC